MDDFSDRLEQLLSDPQALSRLGELAAGLGLGQPPPQQPSGEPSPAPDLSAPDRNTRLLMALQPFCGEHRRKKVEEAAQLLRIIRLLPLLEDKPPAG